MPFDADSLHRPSICLAYCKSDSGIPQIGRDVETSVMLRTQFTAVMDDGIKFLMGFDGIDTFHDKNKIAELVSDLGASFGATPCENLAASSGGHAGTEATHIRVFFL